MELSGNHEQSKRERLFRKISKETLNVAGALGSMTGTYLALQSGALDSIPTPEPLSEHDFHSMASLSIGAGGMAWYSLRDASKKVISRMDGPPAEQK